MFPGIPIRSLRTDPAYDLLAQVRWRRGLVSEPVRIDPAQQVGQRRDLGELRPARRATVEVRPHRDARVGVELTQRVGAELLAQCAVLVAVHGSTPISSIARRSALSP